MGTHRNKLGAHTKFWLQKLTSIKMDLKEIKRQRCYINCHGPEHCHTVGLVIMVINI
jgi:hypothetical protein